MNRSPLRRSPFPIAIGLAATCLLDAAVAQVTDPAVVTNYGTSCGVGLGAADVIQPDGSHAVQFEVTVAPFAPALLALGLDAIEVPLPGGCALLTTPVDVWFAPANGSGVANFVLPIPAATVGSLRVQAATLDALLSITTSSGREVLFPGQSPTADPARPT